MSLELPDVSSLSLDPIPPSPIPHSLFSFELLPPELITAILEILQVSESWLATPPLASLCRTSRLLHSIAHPLLLRSLEVDMKVSLKALEALVRHNHSENLKLIRIFDMDLRAGWSTRDRWATPTEDQLEAIRSLLRGATQLKVFRCLGYSEMLLSVGPSVQEIRLSDMTLSEMSAYFPCLERLTFQRCSFGPGLRFLCLRLQHLQLSKCTFDDMERPQEHRAPFNLSTIRQLSCTPKKTPLPERERLFVESIVPHLDAARLPLRDVDHLPLSLTSNPSITRTYLTDISNVDVDVFHRYRDQIEHLEVHSYLMWADLFGTLDSGEDVLDMGYHLTELAEYIGGGDKLRTLELVLDQIDAYPYLVEVKDELSEFCKVKGVQLKWGKTSWEDRRKV